MPSIVSPLPYKGSVMAERGIYGKRRELEGDDYNGESVERF
jgi:hypothetical protein